MKENRRSVYAGDNPISLEEAIKYLEKIILSTFTPESQAYVWIE